MRKNTGLVLSLMLLVVLAGCGAEQQEVKPGTSYYFTAKIIEVNEDYLFAEVTDNCNSNLSVGATVEVSTEVVSSDGCPDFVVDEYARVSMARNIEGTPDERVEAFSIYKTDDTGNVMTE